MADLFNVFDEVDENFRMLCIDSMYVGCTLYKQCKKTAGKKLITTSLSAAGIDENDLIKDIFNDIEESLNTLRAHRELRSLNPD